MLTKETTSERRYVEMIEHAGSMLNLSLSEIREKYADYPLCLMEYIEKGAHEKSIEIRFEKEKATMACIVNENKECSSVFLFPDDNRFIDDMVECLKGDYEYCYLKSRFILDNCFMKIKESKELKDTVYIFFYK